MISVALEVIIRHNNLFSASVSLVIGHSSTLKDKSGHKNPEKQLTAGMADLRIHG